MRQRWHDEDEYGSKAGPIHLFSVELAQERDVGSKTPLKVENGKIPCTLRGVCSESSIIENTRSTWTPSSGHRSGVEQGDGVVQPPTLNPCLLAAAGDIQNHMEDFPAHIFDRSFSSCNSSGIDVNQIRPLFCQ
jgi:hypothetical protein